MRKEKSILDRIPRIPIVFALIAFMSVCELASGGTSALKWVFPTASAELRIGRRQPGTAGGPERVDGGASTKFCAGTVTLPEGTMLSCKLDTADTAFTYVVCARDSNGENLGGFECGYHGEGGGWECAPVDIGASWCD